MLALVSVLVISTCATAQLPGVGGVINYAPPFDEVGFIQDAGLGAPNGHATFSNMNRTQAGWMILNGHNIVVPQNTVLQMPAIAVTWADLFDPSGAAQVPGSATSAYGGDVTRSGVQTGMAINDQAPKLPGTYEVHVQGNIVNGVYIAGLIFIAPQSLNLFNGFVSHIDYTVGDLYVSGGPGQQEIRVQINDPIGRFGKAHSPDQRFSIDEDNPTIHAGTGYPMCVPRFDPSLQPDNLCPQINRPLNPLGGYAMNFTMPDPHVRAASDPDADLMAPFEVGDYVTISGMLVPDGNPARLGGSYVSAYNIEANVGIYTAPLSDPVYVVMAEMEQGTGGVANVALPQETTSRVRVEGMATDSDPRRTVTINARDTDCNGIVSDRAPWIAGFPIDPGPPTGAVRGRIRWRPAGGPFLPPAREIHVTASGANTSVPTKNGLFPGQYYAPQFTFIFPENLAIGDPPVTLNLSDFVYLTDGIGPFGVDGAGNPVVIGQLNPFPDLVAPATTGCTYNSTTANAQISADAGGPYTISLDSAGNGSVALSGATATFPATMTPAYRWAVLNQPTGAPALTFSANNVLNPTVSVTGGAALTTPLTYQLSLIVSDSADPLKNSGAVVTTVTVNPAAQPPVISGITATPNPATTGQTVNVSVTAFDPAGLPLTYTFSSTCATLVSSTGSTAIFTAPGSATPACPISVTVANNSASSTASTSLAVTAAAAAPVITSVTASPNPVVTNTTATLNAVASDPNRLALTYLWTVTNTSNGSTFTLTGAKPSFTAPTVTAAQGRVNLSVSLTVTNSAGLSTTTATPLTLVVISAPADTLANNGTLYRTTKSRLTINVTSSVVSPSIVLTATLDLINPSTGQHYTATLQNLGGGAYSVDIIGVGLPNTITVTSTGGGTLTMIQSQITVRN
jgi:hypothetical protein